MSVDFDADSGATAAATQDRSLAGVWCASQASAPSSAARSAAPPSSANRTAEQDDSVRSVFPFAQPSATPAVSRLPSAAMAVTAAPPQPSTGRDPLANFGEVPLSGRKRQQPGPAEPARAPPSAAPAGAAAAAAPPPRAALPRRAASAAARMRRAASSASGESSSTLLMSTGEQLPPASAQELVDTQLATQPGCD